MNSNSFFTVTERPYKYLCFSHKSKCLLIQFFLLPQIFMLFFTKSWNSLIIIFLTVLANCLVETADRVFFKNKKDSYDYIVSCLQGILTGFFIPSDFSFAAVFFICLICNSVCHFFIGKFADCWVHSAALTVCVCWILGAEFFPSAQISAQLLMSKTPSLQLIETTSTFHNGFDTVITSFFNKNIFSFFGSSVPEGYFSFLWDTSSSIPAFRFNILTLIASVFLISLDVIKALVPCVFISTYCIFVYFFSSFFYSDIPLSGDILLALFTSGILFTAFFLLQGDGTVPQTVWGKVFYGLCSGLIAFFIIGPGTSPAGAAFTVLTANVLSNLIQSIEKIVEFYVVKNILLPKKKEIEEGRNA